MMLGVIRRRVASGGSSASISGLSRTIQSGTLVPRVSTSVVEALIHATVVDGVRNFSQLVSPGTLVSAKTLRCIAGSCPNVNMKNWSKLFSSESGDLVNAVVPFMGESITDGTLAKFLKSPGDRVEADEPIAQIETDKVTIDVPSPESGVLQKFVAKEGDTVEPGHMVAIISKSGEGFTNVAPSEKAVMPTSPSVEKPKPKGDSVDAVVPFMGESITDGILAKFLKSPGDRVVADELIAQIETDKVTIDVLSPESGVLEKFVAKEGDTVEPGLKIAVISTSGKGITPAAPVEKAVTQPKLKAETAPAVEKPKPKSSSPPPSGHIASEPQLPPKERERRVPMTRLRKRVAARLKDSQNTFALLSTFNEVDMTNLMKLRSEYKDAFFDKHGVKLGFMSGFVKAAVSALQHQPTVNAVIDGDDIIYRDYVDISIAVGTPKGLVVPVLRNAEQMNFAEIEKEINSLAKKANAGSISIDDMAGGSFTISNGGVYGSLLSTPIINPPQSAILGMHSIVKRPMVVGGNIAARPMMYIALTYDHRLVDGREAVLFLRRIKDVVEDPRRLLLDI